jgi:hypothetical protein
MATSSPASRRAEALGLTEHLLDDIELSRLPPSDIARKASRLARLLDDTEAAVWLRQEVGGYDHSSPDLLTPEAFEAARRSNRVHTTADGHERANTTSLGQLEKMIEASLTQIEAAADRPISIQSANPNQYVFTPDGNTKERGAVRNYAGELQGMLDRVVGAIHQYVAERYQELRFGASVESAFEVVRGEVDARISELVPDALPKLSAAFENATSANPEDWASAAATCRRLLKAAADALRPPGDPVNGRSMSDEAYINRLVDWIVRQADSETASALIAADLDYLGRRLDAVQGAGHKGAHAEVDRADASRFVVGTYLALGDVLRLRNDPRRGRPALVDNERTVGPSVRGAAQAN